MALGEANIIPARLEIGIHAVRVNETDYLHAYPVDFADTSPPAGAAASRACLSTRNKNGVREPQSSHAQLVTPPLS